MRDLSLGSFSVKGNKLKYRQPATTPKQLAAQTAINQARAARVNYDHHRLKMEAQRKTILKLLKRVSKGERELYAEKIAKITKGL